MGFIARHYSYGARPWEFFARAPPSAVPPGQIPLRRLSQALPGQGSPESPQP